MLKKFVIIFGIVVFSSITYGKEVTFRLEEGTLTLADLLNGCKEIANSKPSKRVEIVDSCTLSGPEGRNRRQL